jgi:hypothetical protein
MAYDVYKEREMRNYLILVEDEDEGYPEWRDCGEGPFESVEAATEFAQAEVGLPWMVVGIETGDSAKTMRKIRSRNK